MATVGTNAGAMTNECLQGIFDTYGNKIKCIKCASSIIFLNTKLKDNTFTLADISLETIGIVDFMKVRQYNPASRGYYYKIIPTETIGEIFVTENENDPIDIFHI